MKLEHIALDRLSVASVNMRARKSLDIANILPSVRERGILVPLLVRPNGVDDHYEIVAGRRRYLAAKNVAEEKGEFPPLPCAIIEAGDDAAAIEASLIENVARLEPDEVTQWETFARLIREGRTVGQIAATFGITERLVQRILALGNLVPRIRSLYRQDNIDAATIRHLTMATKAQQQEWLKLCDSQDSYAPMGRALKEWLCGGELIATGAALFDLAQYTGPIVSDLFGEEKYFADLEAFWTLQREAIEAKRQAYLDGGWPSVELLEAGQYFQHWQYEKRSKARGGRIYMVLSHRGEVEVHEGWVPRKGAGRHELTGERPKAVRAEITSGLRNYLDLHRHAAVKARLLDVPGIALRLLVAHAISGTGHWKLQADPQRSDRPEIAKSIERSISEILFNEKRAPALASLELDPDVPRLVGCGYSGDTVALFDRLVLLCDEDVMGLAAMVMGETLEAGGPVVDHLGVHLQVDMAELWRADETFFELFRDKAVLQAMVMETAGPEAAAANSGAKGAVLKGIIRDCLAGENGRQKVDGWVPRWLQFPATGYRDVQAEVPAENDQESA